MMQLDSAARELAVLESDVLVLHQSRISKDIAMEGETSQKCDAFVCGGKSGNELWVAAVVYLNVGRRALVYRHNRLGKDKNAFEGAVQEAMNFLTPLGFELDAVNLQYSQAMRHVILKGIRGMLLENAKGARKQVAPDQRRTATREKEAKEVDTAEVEVAGKKKETEINDVIVGLKAELKALRDETQKAMRQTAEAESALKKVRSEAEQVRGERDALLQTVEKERGAARSVQKKLEADLTAFSALLEGTSTELAKVRAATAKVEVESSKRLEKSNAELEHLRKELAVAEKESAALHQKCLNLEETGQETLDQALAELEQVRDELAAFKEDAARMVALHEEKQQQLMDRARSGEAEVDRLMQSLVDSESEWSARICTQEAAMAERIAVLKGVIEQLWPVDGVMAAGVSSFDLARIAAAPLKLSSRATGDGGSVAPKEAVVPRKVPLPKIPIVPDFEDYAPVADVKAVVVSAKSEEPEVEKRGSKELEYAISSLQQTTRDNRYFDGSFVDQRGDEAVGLNAESSAHVSISFDDEDWEDLDLSGGDSHGEPVAFQYTPSLDIWMVDIANVKELQTSVNVQQIAPPGAGPGTYQAFVCWAEKDSGEDACFVVLEQIDGPRKKLVYEPKQAATREKLLHDGLFFVESIGYMMLKVDLNDKTAKRASVLGKCRSFINL